MTKYRSIKPTPRNNDLTVLSAPSIPGEPRWRSPYLRVGLCTEEARSRRIIFAYQECSDAWARTLLRNYLKAAA